MRALLLFGLLTWPIGLVGQSFPAPLTPADGSLVASRLAAFRADARGPYLRIRWFCADGSTAAPITGTGGNPCLELGGGVQHAEMKPAALALYPLGFHLGTILQGTTFEKLFDAGRGHFWLRELVLQQFLFEIDDGWVLERAQFYRGARQIEDEEARGKEILERLLADPEWTGGHFLLASRLVATLPHPRSTQDRSTERIRNLATEIAALDRRFFDIRIKIHSFPSAADRSAVEAFRAGPGLSADVSTRLDRLSELLAAQYDPAQWSRQVESFRTRVPRTFRTEFDRWATTVASSSPDTALASAAALLGAIREHVTSTRDGRGNLVLVDLSLALQEHAFVVAQEGPAVGLTREASLERLLTFADLAYGAGYLSQRERTALGSSVGRLRAHPGSHRARLPRRAVVSGAGTGLVVGYRSCRVRAGAGSIRCRRAQSPRLSGRPGARVGPDADVDGTGPTGHRRRRGVGSAPPGRRKIRDAGRTRPQSPDWRFGRS